MNPTLRSLCAAMIGSLMTMTTPALAREQPGMNLYSPEALDQAAQRLVPRVQQIYERGFEDHFEPHELKKLRGLRLAFPIRDRGDPFTFYSHVPSRTVTLSVQSLLFLEDLCTAYAWLWRNGYSLETIDEYVTMLRYQLPRHMPGGRFLPPLEALHIPDDALDDQAVDGLSLRLRNSAYAFILAHEVGHVYHDHPPPADHAIPRQQIRDDERQADAFALEALRRVANLPMGALVYFQALAYYLPTRGNFATEEAWRKHLKTVATHPVNADRLKHVAAILQKNAQSYLTHEPDKQAGLELVRFIATGIDDIAEVLDDADLQRYMAQKVQQMSMPASLKPRRPKPTTNP